jgi:hypothetical protein
LGTIAKNPTLKLKSQCFLEDGFEAFWPDLGLSPCPRPLNFGECPNPSRAFIPYTKQVPLMSFAGVNAMHCMVLGPCVCVHNHHAKSFLVVLQKRNIITFTGHAPMMISGCATGQIRTWDLILDKWRTSQHANPTICKPTVFSFIPLVYQPKDILFPYIIEY